MTRFVTRVQFYRKLLFKYWWIPALTVLAGLGIESLMLKHVRPTFVSTGRMIVNARLAIPNANVYNEELNYFFGTQVALMQSESVVGRVYQKLKVSNPQLNPVPMAIEVTLSPKTSIFNLRAAGGDADFAQAYLQATMEEYIKLKKDLLTNTTTVAQSGMQEELRAMGAELQKSKDDLLNYQSSNSVVLIQPNGGNNAAEYLLSLNKDLADRNSELLLLKTETLDQNLERLQANGDHKLPTTSTNLAQAGANGASSNGNGQTAGANGVTPANLGGFETDYLQLKQQLIMKKAQRDMLAKFLDTNAPDLVVLNKDIPNLEMQLEIDKQQSEQQLANRQHTLELQINNLTNQIAEWEQKALLVSKKLSEYEVLKENEKRLQTMFDQVQANLQTLDMNKGIGQESVSILEPASPSIPVPPDVQKHMVMAGLIGGVLGFGILLFISLLNDRPSTFTEVEQLFDLPILGQIPLIKSKNKKLPPLLQLEDTRYPLVESYRSLRSALLYKDAVKGDAPSAPKSIVIASAYPSEGKSTTACNFAITMAQAGARVLLIDADLHRGRVHEYFGVAVSPGLAEVFGAQNAWNEAVVATPFKNLFVMPRGVAPRQAGNLFAKSGTFLKEVGAHYDFLIFDSAPVMMADDVLSLAPHADALMLVIRAGFTSGRIAKAAMELLRLRRVNIVGLVFNAVPPNTGDYYNYRAKDYYRQYAPVE